jgi:hypothetical protein
MNYKITQQIALRQANGKMRVYAKGQVVTEAIYTNLPERDQLRCKAILNKFSPTQGRRQAIAWEAQELAYLLNLYLTNIRADGTYDPNKIINLHTAQYPNRAGQGVNQTVCAIRCYDTYVPQDGLHDISEGLLTLLANADAERFWPAVEVLNERNSERLGKLLANLNR